jgi:hypothetical protein
MLLFLILLVMPVISIRCPNTPTVTEPSSVILTPGLAADDLEEIPAHPKNNVEVNNFPTIVIGLRAYLGEGVLPKSLSRIGLGLKTAAIISPRGDQNIIDLGFVLRVKLKDQLKVLEYIEINLPTLPLENFGYVAISAYFSSPWENFSFFIVYKNRLRKFTQKEAMIAGVGISYVEKIVHIDLGAVYRSKSTL